MAEHALLSASAAHRWLNCPPSVMLTKDMPDTTSEYAEEGTLAHNLCELKLQKRFIDKSMTTRKYNSRLKTIKSDPLWSDEMDRHSDTYIDHIAEIAMKFPYEPFIVAEQRVNYSQWAPNGFGTADCVIIGCGELHIVDFKYGKGVPVSAEDNPQLKLYALGAYARYGFLYPIDTVVLHIVQPRLDSIEQYTLTMAELLVWGESIKPIAAQAHKGEGEFNAGKWCRFCKAAATCRKRTEANLMEDFSHILPPLLSDDEVGEVLKRAEDVKSWVEALQEYALNTLLGGGSINGWKVVEGRRVRAFDDDDAALTDLVEGGIEEAVLYQRKSLTLAQIEKAIGKPTLYEIAGKHIVTPKGKPTLAPESDKRPPYRTTAEDDFSEISTF